MIPHDWTKVESSNVEKVKFIQNKFDNNGEVFIQFKTGKTYKYKDVPVKHAQNLVHSSSPYTYFKDKLSGNYEAELTE